MMVGMKTPEDLLRRVRKGNRFLVTSHTSPDGDALGSTLALANALREMGKDVVALNCDGVPAAFDFLPGAKTVVRSLENELSFDVGFVLDAGELRRAGPRVRDRGIDGGVLSDWPGAPPLLRQSGRPPG